jgi:hypothetical protein
MVGKTIIYKYNCTVHPMPKSNLEIEETIPFRMVIHRCLKFIMKRRLHMVSLVWTLQLRFCQAIPIEENESF